MKGVHHTRPYRPRRRELGSPGVVAAAAATWPRLRPDVERTTRTWATSATVQRSWSTGWQHFDRLGDRLQRLGLMRPFVTMNVTTGEEIQETRSLDAAEAGLEAGTSSLGSERVRRRRASTSLTQGVRPPAPLAGAGQRRVDCYWERYCLSGAPCFVERARSLLLNSPVRCRRGFTRSRDETGRQFARAPYQSVLQHPGGAPTTS